MEADMGIGVYCTPSPREPVKAASREKIVVSNSGKASVSNGCPDVQPFSQSSAITVQRNNHFATGTDLVGISTELCKITRFERTGNDNRRRSRSGSRIKSHIRSLTVCCHDDSRSCRQ